MGQSLGFYNLFLDNKKPGIKISDIFLVATDGLVMSELLLMTSHKPGIQNLGRETSFGAVCCSESEAVDDDLYMC